MRFSAIIFFLCIHFIGACQPLTGTWLAAYYRDQPGDRRIFYYRLHLQQNEDSLFGICEVLDAQSDIKGIDPEEAAVQATFKVYNYHYEPSHNRFSLTVGEQLQSNLSAQNAPLFYTLECNVIEADEDLVLQRPRIIYSLLPATDGPVGILRVKKMPVTLPEWNISWPFKKRMKPEVMQTKTTVNERENIIQETIETESAEITIEVYDNGIVDNDTISLYLNEQPVLTRARVSTTPIELQLKLNADRDNMFTLFAHNEGEIPPNTALLILRSGNKEHRVHLKGSLSQNAVLVLRVKRGY